MFNDTEDIFDNLKKSADLDKKKQLTNLKVDYTPFYDPELTAVIEMEVITAVTKMVKFRYLVSKNGENGIGKTTSIYRVVKRKGLNIVQFDASKEFNDDVKMDLKNYVTTYNNPPLVILFDNIEEINLPDWFMPTKEQFDDKTRGKNTFIEVADRMRNKANIIIIATATKSWFAPRMMDEFFYKIKFAPPQLKTLRKIVKQHGFSLPRKFPSDIRQIHYFLKYNGFYTPYKKEENPFNKLRYYLEKYPVRENTDMRPLLQRWLIHNALNNKYLLPKHTKQFYEIIALICIADRYKEPKMLNCLPPLKIKWDTPIMYPK